MLRSRLLTTVALFLAIGYTLPVLCVPVPVAGTTARDFSPVQHCGGCRGHHQQTPAPTHNCCAVYGAPAAPQAATSIAPLNLLAHRQASEFPTKTHSFAAVSADRSEFSPPPPAVLRN